MNYKVVIILTFLSLSNVLAHYQMLYTPNIALPKSKTIDLLHIFTHPFADVHTMDMVGVDEFYSITKKKGKIDLTNTLKPITFNGKYDAGKAYKSKYKARTIGDHILILKPTPYYLADQDMYLQQITKLIVNVAGIPNGWDKDLGLKAEIVPLTKPYAIWEGGSFTGIVKSEGKFVPYASIDVEYLNSDINLKNNQMGDSNYKAPQDAFITLNIKANKDGEFTFSIPKAGFWGFSAVGIGPDKTYKGSYLSQDGIIWVEAKKMQ